MEYNRPNPRNWEVHITSNSPDETEAPVHPEVSCGEFLPRPVDGHLKIGKGFILEKADAAQMYNHGSDLEV